jgi:hypothetical protein
VIEEAPVFRRQHGLDQIIGQFIDRNRIRMQDAALSDLVAVTVEEGDREFVLLAPVGGNFLGGGQRQRQHDDEAGRAERRAFAEDFDEEALDAAGAEAAREDDDLLPDLAGREPRLVEIGIDPGVDLEQERALPQTEASPFHRCFAFETDFSSGRRQPALIAMRPVRLRGCRTRPVLYAPGYSCRICAATSRQEVSSARYPVYPVRPCGNTGSIPASP